MFGQRRRMSTDKDHAVTLHKIEIIQRALLASEAWLREGIELGVPVSQRSTRGNCRLCSKPSDTLLAFGISVVHRSRKLQLHWGALA